MRIMEVTWAVLIFFIFASNVNGNKYTERQNVAQGSDTPFRMMKVNLIWNKAKLRLTDKGKLGQLYQDLKEQDQLETDLKKRRSSGEDEEGDFAAFVRRNFLNVMTKYDLEGIHPENTAQQTNDVINKQRREEKWDKVLLDKRLSKLWKKAQLSGFTEKELSALQGELLHHADKADELRTLQESLQQSGPGRKDNSVDALKDPAVLESLKEERDKHVDLKRQHKKLQQSLGMLEEKIHNEKNFDETMAGGFRNAKVIDMWFAARSSNFTNEELMSLQEELRHFEHKLKKLDHMESEHETMADKLRNKNLHLGSYPEKQLKAEEKIKEYTRKVKKHEHDLRDRIQQASRHNEL